MPLSKQARAQKLALLGDKDYRGELLIYRLNKPQPSEYDALILGAARDLLKRAKGPLDKDSYSDDARDRCVDMIVAYQRLEFALDRNLHIAALKHFADMVRADLGRGSTVNTASSRHPRPGRKSKALYQKQKEQADASKTEKVRKLWEELRGSENVVAKITAKMGFIQGTPEWKSFAHKVNRWKSEEHWS